MKGSIGFVLAALAVVALGTAALEWSRLQRALAGAEEQLVTQQADDVDAVLTRAEKFYAAASYVPGVGPTQLNHIRAQRALVHYWQGDYDAIIPEAPDPIAEVPENNPELQLIVANAMYRSGQSLDTAIAAQLAVLKSSARNPDAAFNYEYLLRVRARPPTKEATTSTSEPTPPKRTLNGESGDPPPDAQAEDFKVHVPLEEKEYGDNADEGDDAGKDGPPPRRG